MHVFVVNVGNPDYAQYTFPFIENYCRRWGYPLTLCHHAPSDGRKAWWQKLLAHTLVSDDHVLILDLDVAPQPYAPALHTIADPAKLGLVAERRREHRMGRMNALGFPADGIIYNSGVISAPATMAKLFADTYARPCQLSDGDQMHLNLEIAAQKAAVTQLDPRWNHSVTHRFNPAAHAHLAWFIHFAGKPQRRLTKSQLLWEYWYGNGHAPLGYVRIFFELVRRSISVPQRGAEVGVAEGELSAALLGAFPNLTLFMIDSWASHSADHPYRLSGDRRATMSVEQQERAFEHAMSRTAFAGERAQSVRNDSVAAAGQFDDGSLDFVFVDADHTYDGCRGDLEAYYPKVRSGGLIAGHDYGHHRYPGVKRAVDEFAACQRLQIAVRESVWSARKP